MKKINAIILPLILIFVFFIKAYPQNNEIFKKEFLYFDFESGSVGSWSSYPPSEDTAYDPSIYIRKIGENNTKALIRETQPNYKIRYYVGIRKKVHFYIDENSKIEFDYFIKSYTGVKSLKIKFAFENSSPKTIEVKNPVILKWCKISKSLKNILPYKSKVLLKAFAIIVETEKADTDTKIKFAVDNVRITGYSKKSFDIESPETYFLKEFNISVLKRHYNFNDKILIRAKAPLSLSKVRLTVKDALKDNKRIERFLKPEGKNIIISLNAKYIGAGFWKAIIKGTTKKGDKISSSLVFFVKPKNPPNDHPLLLILNNQRKELVNSLKSGIKKKMWNDFSNNLKKKWGKIDINEYNYNLDAYDDKYWLPTYGLYANSIRKIAKLAREYAFYYFITKNKEAFNKARKILLKLSEWKTFVHPHILKEGQFTYWPVGKMIGDLAVAYDFIYDGLSNGEKKIISKTLLTKGIIPVFKEYVRDNRVSSNTSNWIADVTGGGILCALAIKNEYKDSELEPYFSGMILKLKALIDNAVGDDGGYGEGLSYLLHALHLTSQVMPALNNNYNVEFPEKLNKIFDSIFYQINPKTHDLYDFGDTLSGNKLHLHTKISLNTRQSLIYNSISHMVYLIKKYKNPYMKWIYDFAPLASDLDILFYPDNVKEKQPPLPPKLKTFKDTGIVSIRDRNSDKDFFFVMHCGPFYNHNHFDQGTFFLSYDGENYITEAGKTDYYLDPWYNSFFIQPIGHNTILINDNPESQNHGDFLKDVKEWKDYAKIESSAEFENEAFVSCNLSKVYRKNTDKVIRNVLYLKPNIIILEDIIKPVKNSQKASLLFHPLYKKDLSIDNGIIRIKRAKNSLYIKTVNSENIKYSILKRPPTLVEVTSLKDPILLKERGYLKIDKNFNGKPVSFLNILTFEKAQLKSLNLKNYDNYQKLHLKGREIFIKKSGGKFISFNGIISDSNFIIKDKNRWIFMYAKTIALKNIIKISSYNKVFSKIELEDNLIKININSPEKTELYIKTFKRISKIIFNKEKIKVQKDIKLKLSSGINHINIILKK